MKTISEKKDIRDLSFPELVSFFESLGEKPFRAKQIFDWIYTKGAVGFDAMTNLPAGLRAALKEQFILEEPVLAHKDVSADGTTKFLFSLEDNEKVETVLIPTETRTTACISTQAGCKFGCRFCASGIGGWARNLTAAEILSEVLYVKNHAPQKDLSHIVFMGVGEPLDNYDNLIKAIRLINFSEGMNFAARRITISTCGLVPKIQRLAKEGLQVELAVSLHGSSNESRNVLMPVNRKYPMKDLIAACREYIKATNRQITFEYILIKDITCTEEAAQELAGNLKGMICKLNLIPYNPVQEFPYKPPSSEEMRHFQKRLKALGIHATLRTPRGRDIAAACGQLRHVTSSDTMLKAYPS